jgi:hypothetical protein
MTHADFYRNNRNYGKDISQVGKEGGRERRRERGVLRNCNFWY